MMEDFSFLAALIGLMAALALVGVLLLVGMLLGEALHRLVLQGRTDHFSVFLVWIGVAICMILLTLMGYPIGVELLESNK